jgi:tellurite resistance protein
MAARRIQLNLFAVPLGLAGLGGAWAAATAILNAPRWIAESFFLASLVFWAVFTVIYLAERRARLSEYREDREHPGTGPNAAFIPVVGILLTAHWAQLLGPAAPWIVGALVAALGVVAVQLLSHWLVGSVSIDSLHPGYFLPLVAGPFIASIGLTAVGLPGVSTAAFAVGVFFWVVLGTIVTARLIVRGPLPKPAVPSLAVLLAPPATGGVAWFIAHPGPLSWIEYSFAGIVAVMLALQFSLIPVYRRAGFGLNFWTFTFPVAATSNFVIRLIGAAGSSGLSPIAWVAIALSTSVVLGIAAASVVTIVRSRRAVANLVENVGTR